MGPSDIFRQGVQRLRAIRTQQWVIGGLSVLMTTIIVVGFLVENRWGYMKPDPIIAYFKSWDAGRTREDAIAVQQEEIRLEAEAEAIAQQLAKDATSAPDTAAAPNG
jgi:hypothetical protein